MKRAIDILFCLLAAPLALPLCLVLLVLIRIDTPGSPLFIQLRVGRHQRPFRMLKLRTMTVGMGDVPSHHVDPATITRVGRISRKLKLDELPQLVNVFPGSMSLVGPRPCLPTQKELIAARADRALFEIRPGITGPAQMRGIDMSDPNRLAEVEHDYFQRATLWTDLLLIAGTAIGAGTGDAAGKAGDDKRLVP